MAGTLVLCGGLCGSGWRDTSKITVPNGWLTGSRARAREPVNNELGINMTHLDCESPEAAVNSLAFIYDIKPEQLIDFFRRFDIDEHYETNKPYLAGHDETRRLLENRFGPPKKQITRTYWYHLTRTEKGASFDDGLLPLNSVLPRVWQMLLRVVSGSHHAERLLNMYDQCVENFHYNLKTPDPLHWGPYAMLVKEIGACATSVGNHDYLQIPEIVEDICSGYAARFGVSIQSMVERALVPTVVKFWSEDQEHLYGLTSAIYYAYLSNRGLELSNLANTCFDGNGRTVPKDRIVYVEQTNA